MAEKQLTYTAEELETFKARIESLEGAPTSELWVNTFKEWYVQKRSTEKISSLVSLSTMLPRLNLINLGDIQPDNNVLTRMINWINLDPVLDGVFSAFVMVGDIISDAQTTKAVYAANCDAFWAQAAESPIPVMTCMGNHECNHDGTTVANYCDKHDQRVNFFQPMLDMDETLVTDINNADACYCYKDFTTHKTRVIAIDQYDFPYTYDGEGIPNYSAGYEDGNIGYSELQLTWLVTALNVPSDWNVIILSHEGIAPNENAVGETDDCLIDILGAFKGKTTVDTTATNPLDFNITGDFSANSGRIIDIHGHNHSFAKTTVGDINCYQVIAGVAGTRDGYSGYLRKNGSIMADAADIFSYNLSTNKFYFLRYGLINRQFGASSYDADINGFHYIDTPETL